MSYSNETPEQKQRKKIGAETSKVLRTEAIRTQNEAAKEGSTPEDVNTRCRIGVLLLQLASDLERGHLEG